MIYHVFANRSNIGDWLSAKGIQKLLSPLEITECLCDSPFVEETMKILEGATENDMIVIGGGGLLMDYFIPFWEVFNSIADRVPFYIWGIGYCDLKNEYSHPPNQLIEDIINKSKYCIVRDELTRSYLTRCQLLPSVPCPSINVVEPVSKMANDLLHVVNYTTAGAETYEHMCKAARAFSEDTGRVYRETNNRISKNSEKELVRTLSLYERSGIILSSALHGCIIGVAMGLKVLAVSGDRKIDSFMEAVGLKDWVLDTTKVHLVSKYLKELQAQATPLSVLENIQGKNLHIASHIKHTIAGHLPASFNFTPI